MFKTVMCLLLYDYNNEVPCTKNDGSLQPYKKSFLNVQK